MASATSLSSSSTALIDCGRTSRPPANASPQCVSLPTLRPQSRVATTAPYCRKIARNVGVMATEDSPVLIIDEVLPPPPAEATAIESAEPDILNTIQDAWDNVDDKYTVTALIAAVLLAIWVSSGMISAVDRLPLIPGVLELVGICYTSWFAFQNLIFQSNREALFRNIKQIYSEITGST